MEAPHHHRQPLQSSGQQRQLLRVDPLLHQAIVDPTGPICTSGISDCSQHDVVWKESNINPEDISQISNTLKFALKQPIQAPLTQLCPVSILNDYHRRNINKSSVSSSGPLSSQNSSSNVNNSSSKFSLNYTSNISRGNRFPIPQKNQNTPPRPNLITLRARAAEQMSLLEHAESWKESFCALLSTCRDSDKFSLKSLPRNHPPPTQSNRQQMTVAQNSELNHEQLLDLATRRLMHLPLLSEAMALEDEGQEIYSQVELPEVLVLTALITACEGFQKRVRKNLNLSANLTKTANSPQWDVILVRRLVHQSLSLPFALPETELLLSTLEMADSWVDSVSMAVSRSSLEATQGCVDASKTLPISTSGTSTLQVRVQEGQWLTKVEKAKDSKITYVAARDLLSSFLQTSNNNNNINKNSSSNITTTQVNEDATMTSDATSKDITKPENKNITFTTTDSLISSSVSNINKFTNLPPLSASDLEALESSPYPAVSYMATRMKQTSSVLIALHENPAIQFATSHAVEALSSRFIPQLLSIQSSIESLTSSSSASNSAGANASNNGTSSSSNITAAMWADLWMFAGKAIASSRSLSSIESILTARPLVSKLIKTKTTTNASPTSSFSNEQQMENAVEIDLENGGNVIDSDVVIDEETDHKSLSMVTHSTNNSHHFKFSFPIPGHSSSTTLLHPGGLSSSILPSCEPDSNELWLLIDSTLTCLTSPDVQKLLIEPSALYLCLVASITSLSMTDAFGSVSEYDSLITQQFYRESLAKKNPEMLPSLFRINQQTIQSSPNFFFSAGSYLQWLSLHCSLLPSPASISTLWADYFSSRLTLGHSSIKSLETLAKRINRLAVKADVFWPGFFLNDDSTNGESARSPLTGSLETQKGIPSCLGSISRLSDLCFLLQEAVLLARLVDTRHLIQKVLSTILPLIIWTSKATSVIRRSRAVAANHKAVRISRDVSHLRTEALRRFGTLKIDDLRDILTQWHATNSPSSAIRSPPVSGQSKKDLNGDFMSACILQERVSLEELANLIAAAPPGHDPTLKELLVLIESKTSLWPSVASRCLEQLKKELFNGDDGLFDKAILTSAVVPDGSSNVRATTAADVKVLSPSSSLAPQLSTLALMLTECSGLVTSSKVEEESAELLSYILWREAVLTLTSDTCTYDYIADLIERPTIHNFKHFCDMETVSFAQLKTRRLNAWRDRLLLLTANGINVGVLVGRADISAAFEKVVKEISETESSKADKDISSKSNSTNKVVNSKENAIATTSTAIKDDDDDDVVMNEEATSFVPSSTASNSHAASSNIMKIEDEKDAPPPVTTDMDIELRTDDGNNSLEDNDDEDISISVQNPSSVSLKNNKDKESSDSATAVLSTGGGGKGRKSAPKAKKKSNAVSSSTTANSSSSSSSKSNNAFAESKPSNSKKSNTSSKDSKDASSSSSVPANSPSPPCLNSELLVAAIAPLLAPASHPSLLKIRATLVRPAAPLDWLLPLIASSPASCRSARDSTWFALEETLPPLPFLLALHNQANDVLFKTQHIINLPALLAAHPPPDGDAPRYPTSVLVPLDPPPPLASMEATFDLLVAVRSSPLTFPHLLFALVRELEIASQLLDRASSFAARLETEQAIDEPIDFTEELAQIHQILRGLFLLLPLPPALQSLIDNLAATEGRAAKILSSPSPPSLHDLRDFKDALGSVSAPPASSKATNTLLSLLVDCEKWIEQVGWLQAKSQISHVAGIPFSSQSLDSWLFAANEVTKLHAQIPLGLEVCSFARTCIYLSSALMHATVSPLKSSAAVVPVISAHLQMPEPQASLFVQGFSIKGEGSKPVALTLTTPLSRAADVYVEANEILISDALLLVGAVKQLHKVSGGLPIPPEFQVWLILLEDAFKDFRSQVSHAIMLALALFECGSPLRKIFEACNPENTQLRTRLAAEWAELTKATDLIQRTADKLHVHIDRSGVFTPVSRYSSPTVPSFLVRSNATRFLFVLKDFLEANLMLADIQAMTHPSGASCARILPQYEEGCLVASGVARPVTLSAAQKALHRASCARELLLSVSPIDPLVLVSSSSTSTAILAPSVSSQTPLAPYLNTPLPKQFADHAAGVIVSCLSTGLHCALDCVRDLTPAAAMEMYDLSQSNPAVLKSVEDLFAISIHKVNEWVDEARTLQASGQDSSLLLSRSEELQAQITQMESEIGVTFSDINLDDILNYYSQNEGSINPFPALPACTTFLLAAQEAANDPMLSACNTVLALSLRDLAAQLKPQDFKSIPSLRHLDANNIIPLHLLTSAGSHATVPVDSMATENLPKDIDGGVSASKLSTRRPQRTAAALAVRSQFVSHAPDGSWVTDGPQGGDLAVVDVDMMYTDKDNRLDTEITTSGEGFSSRPQQRQRNVQQIANLVRSQVKAGRGSSKARGGKRSIANISSSAANSTQFGVSPGSTSLSLSSSYSSAESWLATHSADENVSSSCAWPLIPEEDIVVTNFLIERVLVPRGVHQLPPPLRLRVEIILALAHVLAKDIRMQNANIRLPSIHSALMLLSKSRKNFRFVVQEEQILTTSALTTIKWFFLFSLKYPQLATLSHPPHGGAAVSKTLSAALAEEDATSKSSSCMRCIPSALPHDSKDPWEVIATANITLLDANSSTPPSSSRVSLVSLLSPAGLAGSGDLPARDTATALPMSRLVSIVNECESAPLQVSLKARIISTLERSIAWTCASRELNGLLPVGSIGRAYLGSDKRTNMLDLLTKCLDFVDITKMKHRKVNVIPVSAGLSAAAAADEVVNETALECSLEIIDDVKMEGIDSKTLSVDNDVEKLMDYNEGGVPQMDVESANISLQVDNKTAITETKNTLNNLISDSKENSTITGDGFADYLAAVSSPLSMDSLPKDSLPLAQAYLAETIEHLRNIQNHAESLLSVSMCASSASQTLHALSTSLVSHEELLSHNASCAPTCRIPSSALPFSVLTLTTPGSHLLELRGPLCYPRLHLGWFGLPNTSSSFLALVASATLLSSEAFNQCAACCRSPVEDAVDPEWQNKASSWIQCDTCVRWYHSCCVQNVDTRANSASAVGTADVDPNAVSNSFSNGSAFNCPVCLSIVAASPDKPRTPADATFLASRVLLANNLFSTSMESFLLQRPDRALPSWRDLLSMLAESASSDLRLVSLESDRGFLMHRMAMFLHWASLVQSAAEKLGLKHESRIAPDMALGISPAFLCELSVVRNFIEFYKLKVEAAELQERSKALETGWLLMAADVNRYFPPSVAPSENGEDTTSNENLPENAASNNDCWSISFNPNQLLFPFSPRTNQDVSILAGRLSTDDASSSTALANHLFLDVSFLPPSLAAVSSSLHLLPFPAAVGTLALPKLLNMSEVPLTMLTPVLNLLGRSCGVLEAATAQHDIDLMRNSYSIDPNETEDNTNWLNVLRNDLYETAKVLANGIGDDFFAMSPVQNRIFAENVQERLESLVQRLAEQSSLSLEMERVQSILITFEHIRTLFASCEPCELIALYPSLHRLSTLPLPFKFAITMVPGVHALTRLVSSGLLDETVVSLPALSHLHPLPTDPSALTPLSALPISLFDNFMNDVGLTIASVSPLLADSQSVDLLAAVRTLLLLTHENICFNADIDENNPEWSNVLCNAISNFCSSKSIDLQSISKQLTLTHAIATLSSKSLRAELTAAQLMSAIRSLPIGIPEIEQNLSNSASPVRCLLDCLPTISSPLPISNSLIDYYLSTVEELSKTEGTSKDIQEVLSATMSAEASKATGNSSVKTAIYDPNLPDFSILGLLSIISLKLVERKLCFADTSSQRLLAVVVMHQIALTTWFNVLCRYSGTTLTYDVNKEISLNDLDSIEIIECSRGNLMPSRNRFSSLHHALVSPLFSSRQMAVNRYRFEQPTIGGNEIHTPIDTFFSVLEMYEMSMACLLKLASRLQEETNVCNKRILSHSIDDSLLKKLDEMFSMRRFIPCAIMKINIVKNFVECRNRLLHALSEPESKALALQQHNLQQITSSDGTLSASNMKVMQGSSAASSNPRVTRARNVFVSAVARQANKAGGAFGSLDVDEMEAEPAAKPAKRAKRTNNANQMSGMLGLNNLNVHHNRQLPHLSSHAAAFAHPSLYHSASAALGSLAQHHHSLQSASQSTPGLTGSNNLSPSTSSNAAFVFMQHQQQQQNALLAMKISQQQQQQQEEDNRTAGITRHPQQPQQQHQNLQSAALHAHQLGNNQHGIYSYHSTSSGTRSSYPDFYKTNILVNNPYGYVQHPYPGTSSSSAANSVLNMVNGVSATSSAPSGSLIGGVVPSYASQATVNAKSTDIRAVGSDVNDLNNISSHVSVGVYPPGESTSNGQTAANPTSTQIQQSPPQ